MEWNLLAPGASSYETEDALAPLFRDPVFDGAADPSIMWLRENEEQWLFYTQRRSNINVPGEAWIHGSEIDVATATDSGCFLYRGTLDLDIATCHNTHQAPKILYHDGTYHLYVSDLPGVPQAWEGPRYIVYCTSSECRKWTVDSDDLYDRTARKTPVLDDQPQEVPIVFEWRDYYWLLTDSWNGLSVYRSPDGREWAAQSDRLLTEAGKRSGDDYVGGHLDVFVVDDRAYLLYHVLQPGDGRRYTVDDGRARQTVLQVTELDVEDDRLACDRD